MTGKYKNIKKLSTIQVDVDSFWAIAENAKIPFNAGTNKAIYELAIPRFLSLFKEFDIKATFFVIGKDILNQNNKVILKKVIQEGHEVANHTMNHRSNQPFSSLTSQEIVKEIQESHEVIVKNLGVNPVGFKAPAYSFLPECAFSVLNELGYLYDSSSMSVFGSSLLKGIQFIFRKNTGQSYWQGQRIEMGVEGIKQIPVSTTPFIKLPFNSTFVFTLGLWWFKLAYFLRKKQNSALNYLFHAVDLVDRKEISSQLLKLLGLDHQLSDKMRVSRHIISKIKDNYQILPTKELSNLL